MNVSRQQSSMSSNTTTSPVSSPSATASSSTPMSPTLSLPKISITHTTETDVVTIESDQDPVDGDDVNSEQLQLPMTDSAAAPDMDKKTSMASSCLSGQSNVIDFLL